MHLTLKGDLKWGVEFDKEFRDQFFVTVNSASGAWVMRDSMTKQEMEDHVAQCLACLRESDSMTLNEMPGV